MALKRNYHKPRNNLVPTPNTDGYGKKPWEWNKERLRAAEMFADGHSQTRIANEIGVHRNTIQNWCKVPDFCHKVDELIMETGAASKRERIARMKRMFDKLEDVFEIKIDQLLSDPSEESVKSITSEMRELLKQIAQEKEEFIEISRTEHTGSVGVDLNIMASVEEVEKYLKSKGEQERNELKAEFAKVADSVIAGVVK